LSGCSIPRFNTGVGFFAGLIGRKPPRDTQEEGSVHDDTESIQYESDAEGADCSGTDADSVSEGLPAEGSDEAIAAAAAAALPMRLAHADGRLRRETAVRESDLGNSLSRTKVASDSERAACRDAAAQAESPACCYSLHRASTAADGDSVLDPPAPGSHNSAHRSLLRCLSTSGVRCLCFR